MGNTLTFVLNAKVQAMIASNHEPVWRDGVVTGRTLEENPRYDVRFADGSIAWDLPVSRLRVRGDVGLG